MVAVSAARCVLRSTQFPPSIQEVSKWLSFFSLSLWLSFFSCYLAVDAHSPRERAHDEGRDVIYVDDAFVGADWGKWSGGGHMQADDLDELHAFAASIGLKRAWFQDRPDRPEASHYDLTRGRRDAAILAGAIPEAVEDGTARRRSARKARHD